MDDTIVCNHDNQILLNAIKSKFSGLNTKDEASFSPPKFNIPLLRASGSSTLSTHLASVEISSVDNRVNSPTVSTASTSTQVPGLNEFILKKLEESTTHEVSRIVPQQNAFKHNISTSFNYIDNSSNGAEAFHMHSLSGKMDDLSVSDKSVLTKTNIDLSTALSCCRLDYSLSDNSKCGSTNLKKDEKEDFEIPFIACDLKEKPILVPEPGELYQSNNFKLKLKHYLIQPSSFARIACLKFKRTVELPPINCGFKTKYNIKPFRFDTKSPDDIILANLKKYQR